MEATKLLKRDHARVRLLIGKLKELGDRSVTHKKEIFETLKAEVEVHSQIEEEIFYPFAKKLHSAESQKMVDESLEEHRVVKRLLNEIALLAPGDDKFEAKFKVMSENLLHHAEEEETEFFPIVVAKASLADRDEIGLKLEKRKDALQLGWSGMIKGWLQNLIPQEG